MRYSGLITAGLAMLAAMLAINVSAQERLLLGTEGAYPPFNNLTASGELEGFDIEIGNALCAEMKVECEWVVQDWDGMIPALKAGKFNAAVASMFITEERRKQIDFTNPYYSTPPAVVVRKDSEIAGATPDDLAGRAVGVQGSSVYAIYAEKYLTRSVVKPYPAVPEMTSDLANGRIEAVNDDLVVLKAFLESAEGACCRLAGTQKQIPEIHGPGAGIAIRKGDMLRDRLNSALKEILRNGTYAEIYARYFGADAKGYVP